MANADVFEAFRYQDESLSDSIHEQAMASSMWLNIIPRGVCKMGAGTRFVNFAIGNSEVFGTVGQWRTLALSRHRAATAQDGDVTDEDVFATNLYQQVGFGGTELEYQPEYWEMRGPELSSRQLMFSHNRAMFLENYIERLGDRCKREWEMCYQLNYVKLSAQAVATSHFSASYNQGANVTVDVGTMSTPGDPSTFAVSALTPDAATYTQRLRVGVTTPLKAVTSILSQEMMEYLARNLIDLGASKPDTHGFIQMGEAGPVFSTYIDPVLSNTILRLNPAMREDWRYAMPSELIKAIGAHRVLGNWRHVPNMLEMRWTFTAAGGVDADGDTLGYYTYIDPYVPAGSANAYGTLAGTLIGDGVLAAHNKLWRDATIGSIHVLNEKVFTSEIIPADGAQGLDVPPANWMGDLTFVAGAYKFGSANVVDPLNQRGAHFGQFGHAPSANPAGAYNYGWLVFYDRTKMSGASANNVTTID